MRLFPSLYHNRLQKKSLGRSTEMACNWIFLVPERITRTIRTLIPPVGVIKDTQTYDRTLISVFSTA